MASSEWMELENLSREISDSQGRLEAAKSVESFELAAVLEREIAEMEERRGKLLAHIANSVIGEESGGGKEKQRDETAEAAAESANPNARAGPPPHQQTTRKQPTP